MPNNEKYFPYNVEFGETLESISQHFYGGRVKADTLLNYLNNSNVIFSLYTDAERKEKVVATTDLINPCTILFLPIDERKLILGFEKPVDYDTTGILDIKKAWWSERVDNYLDKKMTVLKQKDNEEYLVKRTNYYFVKIWSRVLNEVLSVTAHTIDFNINVAEDGGRFSFSLPAISAIWKDNKWKMINIQNFGQEQSLSKTNLIFTSDLNILFNTYSIKSFSDLYYEKVLNPQDLVFIKLDEPFSQPTDLDFDDFDMIGAIDSIKPIITQNENNIEAIIKISGRDLMKLFVEDGTYFYPIENYVGEKPEDTPNIIVDDPKDFAIRIFGKLYSPILFEGGLLKRWLAFIKEHLTVTDWGIPNVTGIVPPGLNEPKLNGIWEWIEFEIEEVAGKRWITKPSIGTMQGSVINYLRQLADQPFVEIIAETFGSKYSMIFRTPPYSKEAYLNNRTLELSMKYLISNDTGIDDKNIHSWFWLKPEGYLWLQTDVVYMNLFAPIYLSKLAKIFGSKKFDKIHKYSYFGNDGKTLLDSKIQPVEDFKWLVESFVTEPFMKKGTLTFKNVSGIKRGINIYIPETDMLYYVKSYSHSIGITDRVTTVQVERGLPKKYIDVFYNLVKIGIDKNKNQVTSVDLDEEVLKKLLDKKYD